MDTDLTNRNFLRLSHFIVNGKYSLSIAEINVILTLLTAINKEDEDFKDYSFTLAEFNTKTDKNMTSTEFKKVVISLSTKPISIDISKKWEVFNWFSYFKYENGMIGCRFDKALKPYLLMIAKRFVLSELKTLLAMRSSYSKRIYLLLKEYAKIGKRVFNVEELQEILDTPNSHKTHYNKFKTSVLQKAETDINKFSDLEVKLFEKKRLRKVVEISYSIKKNHTDLKAFISYIRELYINELLFYTQDNKPLKCSQKGLLYYADNNESINKKEAQKLWEYLHENRESLYIFKSSFDNEKKSSYLDNIEIFKRHIQKNFAHKKIVKLKKNNKLLEVSIFPNGNLYDMSGEPLSEIDKVWDILYGLGEDGRFGVGEN
jgi:hypothetical protein